MAQHDTITSISDKASLAVSSGLLGYLSAHEQEINIILTLATFSFTAISLIVSVYFQIQRNKRNTILFNERRTGLKPDNGHRNRASDHE